LFGNRLVFIAVVARAILELRSIDCRFGVILLLIPTNARTKDEDVVMIAVVARRKMIGAGYTILVIISDGVSVESLSLQLKVL